jgi:hypothetical protein
MTSRSTVRDDVDKDYRRGVHPRQNYYNRRDYRYDSRYDEYHERLQRESYYKGLRDARAEYARERDQYDRERHQRYDDYDSHYQHDYDYRRDDNYRSNRQYEHTRNNQETRNYAALQSAAPRRRYQHSEYRPRDYTSYCRSNNHNIRPRYTDLDVPNDSDVGQDRTCCTTETTIESVVETTTQEESPKFSDDECDEDECKDTTWIDQPPKEHDLPKRRSSHNSPESRPESLEFDPLSDDSTKKRCGACGHIYPAGQLTNRTEVLNVCLQCDLPPGWAMKMSTRHNRPFFFQVDDRHESKKKNVSQWEHPATGNVLNSEFD